MYYQNLLLFKTTKIWKINKKSMINQLKINELINETCSKFSKLYQNHTPISLSPNPFSINISSVCQTEVLWKKITCHLNELFQKLARHFAQEYLFPSFIWPGPWSNDRISDAKPKMPLILLLSLLYSLFFLYTYRYSFIFPLDSNATQ